MLVLKGQIDVGSEGHPAETPPAKVHQTMGMY